MYRVCRIGGVVVIGDLNLDGLRAVRGTVQTLSGERQAVSNEVVSDRLKDPALDTLDHIVDGKVKTAGRLSSFPFVVAGAHSRVSTVQTAQLADASATV
jgi:hypothetical protein